MQVSFIKPTDREGTEQTGKGRVARNADFLIFYLLLFYQPMALAFGRAVRSDDFPAL